MPTGFVLGSLGSWRSVATCRQTLGGREEYLEGGVDVGTRSGCQGRGQLAASREMAEQADDAGTYSTSLGSRNSHGLSELTEQRSSRPGRRETDGWFRRWIRRWKHQRSRSRYELPSACPECPGPAPKEHCTVGVAQHGHQHPCDTPSFVFQIAGSA